MSSIKPTDKSSRKTDGEEVADFKASSQIAETAAVEARIIKLGEQLAEYDGIMKMPGTHVVHMEKWVDDVKFLLRELGRP